MTNHIEHIPVSALDRETDITDLLREVDQRDLLHTLESILGRPASLSDASGKTLLGDDTGQGRMRAPLRGELEPIAYLCADDDRERVSGVARLLELVMRATSRYQTAAALHLHTVRDDFDELQRRHEALQESEERYRRLSQELERRVQDQVQALDTAQRQLYQAERLRAVGQLAAGVAHEINNPIGFVKSNLTTGRDYLQRIMKFREDIGANKDTQEMQDAWSRHDLDDLLHDFDDLLQESLDGATRVARIVEDLKSFSRVDAAGDDTIDINEIIQRVCNVAAPVLGENIRLVLEAAPAPTIRGDAAALGQVFYNLFVNAAEAMGNGGTLRIASRYEGENIVVGIEDEGIGIPADVLPRIFEPFFTTKDVGQGTGLGLTVSMNIARAHGGNIEVESAAGRGSRFRIILPHHPHPEQR